MPLFPNMNRTVRLVLAVTLLSSTLIGCSRSSSLPPLVEGSSTAQIPGKFVWHNLVTNDGEAAREFYGELLGWEFDVKDEGRYSVILYEGKNLGGILDTSKQDEPSEGGRWLSAMSVANLDASLAAVAEAGGKQLEAPIEVSGVGSVVTVEDSDGARLHLLASSGADPPDIEPPVHTWLWHELLSNDAGRVTKFYETAFGYRVEALQKKPDSDYRVLWSSGGARAGILQNPFEKTRSTWIPYVRVDDPATLAQRASELGGRVIIAPRPDVREGTLALVVDPSGAPLALQKWSPDAELSP